VFWLQAFLLAVFHRTRVGTVIFHSRNVSHRKRHQKHFTNEMGDDFCWYLQ